VGIGVPWTHVYATGCDWSRIGGDRQPASRIPMPVPELYAVRCAVGSCCALPSFFNPCRVQSAACRVGKVGGPRNSRYPCHVRVSISCSKCQWFYNLSGCQGAFLFEKYSGFIRSAPVFAPLWCVAGRLEPRRRPRSGSRAVRGRQSLRRIAVAQSGTAAEGAPEQADRVDHACPIIAARPWPYGQPPANRAISRTLYRVVAHIGYCTAVKS